MLQAAYVMCATLLVGSAALVVLSERCQRPQYKCARTTIMVCVCLYGWAHMAHNIAILGGLDSEDSSLVLRMWATAFGCYAVGLAFFVSSFPERRWPGTFDYVVSAVHVLRIAGEGLAVWSGSH